MAKVILVVDDALTVRNLAQFALTKGGYVVMEAEDGIKGLETLKANKIDLIISDINMPNMNGMDMVRNIKADANLKNIPIFMLTTEASAEIAQQGKELGVTAWIVKPFVSDKLVAAVNKVLK